MKLELHNKALYKTQAFINGEWLNASSEEDFPVLNPATGECIANVANCGKKEVDLAIDSAQRAMHHWQQQPFENRSRILEKWYDLMIENKDDLAAIMTLEQGKPLHESLGEIQYAASYIKWFAEEAKRIYGDILPSASPATHKFVLRQAVGIVAAITPWNFPSAMITRKVAPALAAGCAIIVKPSEETPLSALAVAELASASGLPSGIINILPTTEAKTVGNYLLSNKAIKKITFTGSTAVGKHLIKQSADTVKKVSMELGGNAPVIVFDDCNLEETADKILQSKFRNSGQTCICANRILIQDSIHDELVNLFIEKIKTFNVGNGFDPSVTHGPIITNKALSQIHEKVKSAVASGGKILIGGEKIDNQQGYFYQPTVLTNITDDMAIFKEEIFGPVLSIVKFSTEEQAISMANDTEYGLAAYIFTENMSRSWRVSQKIDYGMIGVNETAISSEAIPFGGLKESGIGREGSKYGLDDYLEIKYICMHTTQI